jgi:hypothetical protein
LSGYEPWQVAMALELPSNGMLGKLSSLYPKLHDDGSNWVLYKECIWNILVGLDYRKHLTGQVKPPAALKILSSMTDAEKETLTEVYEDALDDYHKKESSI